MMSNDPPDPTFKLRATPSGHITCRACAGTRAKTCPQCDSLGRERAVHLFDDGRTLRIGDVAAIDTSFGRLEFTVLGFGSCYGHEEDDTIRFGLRWPTVRGELHAPELVPAQGREQLRDHGVHASLILRNTLPRCAT